MFDEIICGYNCYDNVVCYIILYFVKCNMGVLLMILFIKLFMLCIIILLKICIIIK